MKEDLHTEYKLRFTHHIAKTICAFLNTDGGNIYVGYDDNGELIGLEQVYSTFSAIDKLIITHFPNHIQNIVVQLIENNNKRYIVIQVRKSNDESPKAFITNHATKEKEFYIRQGDITRKATEGFETEIERVDKTIFPILKHFDPTRNIDKNNFIELKGKNEVQFYQIGNLPQSNYLYKYMDLESALLSIRSTSTQKSSIRFVEPTSWDDQYEGRFYNAIYKSNNQEIDASITPFLYACCFTTKRDNEAAWVLYPHNRTGLASRCVEFTLNRSRLRQQLVENIHNCHFYIGAVEYLNKERIDCVHLPYIDNNNSQPNPNYNKYFNNFDLMSYIQLLLLKRTTFSHENEVRIMIVPQNDKTPKTHRNKNGKFNDNEKPKCLYVNINWIDVIEGIKIDKDCTDFEMSLLQQELNKLLEEKREQLSPDKYDKLKLKFQLKKFDPYVDDSLQTGPLEISIT